MEARVFTAATTPTHLRALPGAPTAPVDPVVRIAGDRIVVERLVLADGALAAGRRVRALGRGQQRGFVRPLALAFDFHLLDQQAGTDRRDRDPAGLRAAHAIEHLVVLRGCQDLAQRRQRAVGVEPQDLQLEVGLRQLLPDDRILARRTAVARSVRSESSIGSVPEAASIDAALIAAPPAPDSSLMSSHATFLRRLACRRAMRTAKARLAMMYSFITMSIREMASEIPESKDVGEKFV